MRIAIVDDLAGERALLREQLARQLARRGAEAELLNLTAARRFSRQKKSGVSPPPFWIFIWRA